MKETHENIVQKLSPLCTDVASLRLLHKHVFDVDRVSSLIDIDQRHTVDFRIHSEFVGILDSRRKHVTDNISEITQLCAFL